MSKGINIKAMIKAVIKLCREMVKLLVKGRPTCKNE